MKKAILISCFLVGYAQSILSSEKNQTATPVTITSIKNQAAAYFAAIKNYFAKPSSLYPAQTHSKIADYQDMTSITEYDVDKKELKLILTEKSNSQIQETPGNYLSWPSVISYQLSPSRNYLFVNTTTLSEKESLVAKAAEKLGKLAGQHLASRITKLIHVPSLKEIASFSGPLITYQYSPDETSLVIATAQKNVDKKIKEKGALIKPGIGLETVTGEMLCYQIFDIASRTMIKTFSNVKALVYISDTELIIKYDNDVTEKITIKRNTLTWLQKIINIFKKQPTIRVMQEQADKFIDFSTSYNLTHQQLTVESRNKHTEKFPEKESPKTLSYSISPGKNYLLIDQAAPGTYAAIQGLASAASGLPILNSKTIIVNIADGKKIEIGRNIVTHEFSPDEKSLLFFGSPLPISQELPPGDPQYQIFLMDTKNISPLEQTNKIRSAYFTSANTLILVDEKGMKKQMPLKTLFPEETALQAVQQRGIEAVRAQLPEALKAAKETAQEYVESAKQAVTPILEKAQKKASKFTQQATDWLHTKISSEKKEEAIQPLTKEEKQKYLKIYNDLPEELQKIVPKEEFFDLPEKEDEEEYFLHSEKAEEIARKNENSKNEKLVGETIQQKTD